MKKILIMGLPGSGKTTLAVALKKYIESQSLPIEGAVNTVDWFNADEIRKRFNDWDFSHDGRIRQSIRMAEFAIKSTSDYVIADFVAPLPEMRNNFKADLIIWVNTIKMGRFEDTNKAFIPPTIFDFEITEQDSEKWAKIIGDHIFNAKNVNRFFN